MPGDRGINTASGCGRALVAPAGWPRRAP